MDSTIILSIAIGIVALIVGIIAGKFIFAKDTKHKVEEAEGQAKKIITDAQAKAETYKKQSQLEAKEKFLQLRADHDKEVLDRNRKIGESENRIKQRELGINQKETGLDKQIKENEAIKENLNRQIEVINLKRTELESTRKSTSAAWKKWPSCRPKTPKPNW